MKTFFDSSAFAKRYIEERGSQQVEDLCLAATELGLSVLCVPEMLSALNRRVSERSVSRAQYGAAKRHLLDDVGDAVIVNLSPSVVAACVAVLESAPLRAMDALHAACAQEWGADLFVSGDRRQVEAARRQGLTCRLV